MGIAIVVFSVLYIAGRISASESSYNYNETHLWCDGTITERELDSTVRCCGSSTYDPQTEACCGQNPDDLPYVNSTVYHCCTNLTTKEQTAFDNSRFLCCNGAIVVRDDPEKLYGCCGFQLFQYEDSQCCDEKIVPKIPNQICCGNKVLYDSQTEICRMNYDAGSNGWAFKIIYTGNNYTDHCNNEPYNTNTHACCSSTVHQKSESLKHLKHPGCCQTGSNVTLYDYDSHVCCSSGELLEIPADLDEGLYAECCGPAIFTNHTWQQCCNDVIVDREVRDEGMCCGTEMIHNTTTKLCCGGSIYDQPTRGQLGCCEQELIDMEFQYCCGGIHTNVDTKNSGCCHSGGKLMVYDMRREMCDAGGITRLKSDRIFNF